ncbi:hypothetical protein ACLQ2R_30910 [Streptosporangium sp. DT93]|uniref:hypothetical protein n=1 Tax=Streptosporangium sp. DT93 TaxID=3393428 RepID=UPI003CECB5EE
MLDKDAYRRDVLDPARARGNTPPADLLARYALRSSGSLSGEPFERHLEEVVAYWRTLRQQKRSYARLVDALLVAHGDLRRAGTLTWDGLTAETARQVADATARVTATVAALAGTSTLVGRATLDHLVAETSGACTEADVRRVLARHGIGVVERPWRLPDVAPPAYRTLRPALSLLGMRLSAEVVVGTDAVRRGFRLRDGFRLTAASTPSGRTEGKTDGEKDGRTDGRLTGEMIAAAVRDAAGRARDERKTATDGVLATLAEAAREPGRLDTLLLWEVVEILRPEAAAGMPPKVLAALATGLGLAEEEAGELALAVAARDVRAPGVESLIQEALQEGRLRAAERLLPGLPAGAPPELRARIEERVRQVAGWSEQATGEIAAGRPEAAAELLDRAWRVAADDEAIGDRLRALPPPPPGEVRTGAGEGRVTVAWTPGPARVGPVRHRVVRTAGAPARGAADGVVIGETDSNELVDDAPPPAEDLYYCVFAGRTEGIWSAPATGPRVTVLPEVAAVRVVSAEREVTATWRLPRGAVDVVVTPLDGRDGSALRAGRSGFADTDVVPGRAYRYRVQAAYERSDGTRRLSRGVVAGGSPESPPLAVPDLSVEHAGGDPPAARITWTPPSAGRVVIRISDVPPPWPAGTSLPEEDVERYGRPVPGAAVPGADGRVTLSTTASPAGGAGGAAGAGAGPGAGAADPAPGGGYFVAVSVGAGRAVVGASARLVVVDPVRELTAHRLGDTTVLSWVWPPGAQLAEVTWAPGDTGPSGAGGTGGSGGSGGADPGRWPGAVVVECRRRGYEDNGFRLRVGPGATVASVRTVVGRLRSRPVTAAIPAIGPEVRYEFRKPRLSRRSAVLVLSADRPCRVPPLLVVHRAGGVIPLRPEQGTVIHEVPAHDLGPGEPLTLRVDVPSPPGSCRLACFPAPGATDDVTLVRLPGIW